MTEKLSGILSQFESDYVKGMYIVKMGNTDPDNLLYAAEYLLSSTPGGNHFHKAWQYLDDAGLEPEAAMPILAEAIGKKCWYTSLSMLQRIDLPGIDPDELFRASSGHFVDRFASTFKYDFSIAGFEKRGVWDDLVNVIDLAENVGKEEQAESLRQTAIRSYLCEKITLVNIYKPFPGVPESEWGSYLQQTCYNIVDRDFLMGFKETSDLVMRDAILSGKWELGLEILQEYSSYNYCSDYCLEICKIIRKEMGEADDPDALSDKLRHWQDMAMSTYKISGRHNVDYSYSSISESMEEIGLGGLVDSYRPGIRDIFAAIDLSSVDQALLDKFIGTKGVFALSLAERLREEKPEYGAVCNEIAENIVSNSTRSDNIVDVAVKYGLEVRAAKRFNTLIRENPDKDGGEYALICIEKLCDVVEGYYSVGMQAAIDDIAVDNGEMFRLMEWRHKYDLASRFAGIIGNEQMKEAYGKLAKN